MNINFRQFLGVIFTKNLRESGISSPPWGPIKKTSYETEFVSISNSMLHDIAFFYFGIYQKKSKFICMIYSREKKQRTNLACTFCDRYIFIFCSYTLVSKHVLICHLPLLISFAYLTNRHIST